VKHHITFQNIHIVGAGQHGKEHGKTMIARSNFGQGLKN